MRPTRQRPTPRQRTDVDFHEDVAGAPAATRPLASDVGLPRLGRAFVSGGQPAGGEPGGESPEGNFGAPSFTAEELIQNWYEWNVGGGHVGGAHRQSAALEASRVPQDARQAIEGSIGLLPQVEGRIRHAGGHGAGDIPRAVPYGQVLENSRVGQ